MRRFSSRYSLSPSLHRSLRCSLYIRLEFRVVWNEELTEMALPDHWEAYFAGGQLHNVKMFCPHCQQPSTFAVMYSELYKNMVGNPYYAVIECNYAKCHKRVFVITTNRNNAAHQHPTIDDLTYYPSAAIPLAHEAFPKPIGEDWTEAQKAFNVNAVKAAAVMCRRVLYG